MARRRRNLADIPSEDSLLEYEMPGLARKERTWKQRLLRCGIISLIVILTIALLIFLVLFVILPLVFMNSIELQRSLCFQTFDTNPKNPEFTNFRKYGIEGVRNLYVTVNDSLSWGVWHVLPLPLVMDALETENYNYEQALAQGDYPVILYFHGTGGHRITPVNTYRVLRRYFHVIAFDYRGYADSTEAEITELNVVGDSVTMYKWLRMQTRAEIFVWGHSLGTSLSLHTLSKLRAFDIIPMGLFLEAPFTSIRDVFATSIFTKLFQWMPWFEATMLDPLAENGFRFRSIDYILGVDCPIMIFHAEDDLVVEYELSRKLYQTAMAQRVPKVQGNITYHLFPGNLRYNHLDIYQAPELPDLISEHITTCREANLGKG